MQLDLPTIKSEVICECSIKGKSDAKRLVIRKIWFDDDIFTKVRSILVSYFIHMNVKGSIFKLDVRLPEGRSF